MGASAPTRPDARLVLPGSGATPAAVEVVYQPRSTRLTRSLIALGLGVAAAPVAFFIPPHFLWPLVALATGGYLARRYWVGEYYVQDFEGRCPRCDSELALPAGSRIRQRHTLECFDCHRSPELVLRDEPE